MIIELNPTLVERASSRNQEWEQRSLEEFYARLNRKICTETERYQILRKLSDTEDVEGIQSGFLYLLSDAYSNHRKIVLAPHDIWYIILTELTLIIEANVNKCRPLFTRSDEKVEILIQTDDVTTIHPYEILEKLKLLVPVDIDLFLPQFSTATNRYNLAAAATFAGGLKHYYNYMTFCCGIPEIKITGLREDWELLAHNMKDICMMLDQLGVEVFEKRKIVDWYNDVVNVVAEIIMSLDGSPNFDFMKSIFTQKNVGSGGELNVSGWITRVFCAICSSPKIENFAATWGMLPYKNLETGREFLGVHGAFNRKRDEDGFVYASYDEVLFEKVALDTKLTPIPFKMVSTIITAREPL